MNPRISNCATPDYYEEGLDNNINELSRQLSTYYNLRESIIPISQSVSETGRSISYCGSIHKWEEKLYPILHDYNTFVEKYLFPKEKIQIKFLGLREGALLSPSSPKAYNFRNFLHNHKKLWELAHILSTLEIRLRPQLLKLIIQMITQLLMVEREINENMSMFYTPLALLYEKLEGEYEHLLTIKEVQESINELKDQKLRIQ